MDTLRKIFHDVQLLDEHTKAVFAQPIAPAYAAFSIEFRTLAEQKLRRASEFFASVVLAFVIRDLALLLDKYVKKCEKVLEDWCFKHPGGLLENQVKWSILEVYFNMLQLIYVVAVVSFFFSPFWIHISHLLLHLSSSAFLISSVTTRICNKFISGMYWL